MKTILVTGSNGLLGQKLTQLYLKKEDKKLIASGKGPNRNPSKSGYEYEEMDICNHQQVRDILIKYRPDTVIHTAAMTKVDDCEFEKETCMDLNVYAVENLAKLSKEIGFHLVHISTDFIFDGEKFFYKEEDQANPLSFYGESKWLAEKAVEKFAENFAILRTVLVYGVTADMSRTNIVLWAKGALAKGNPINVVNDQWRTPTLAEDLALGCYLAEEKKAQGVFNIAGKDLLRIDELVRAVANFWGLNPDLVNEVSSSTLNQAAKRPPKTGLDIEKARNVLGYEPKSFEEGLALVDKQLNAI